VFNAELYSTLSWSLEKVERYEMPKKALKGEGSPRY